MTCRHRVITLLFAASTLPLSQVVFPGCATIMSGPRQEVRVRSKPAAAEVFLNNKLVGTTPSTVFVSRWGVHRVRIEMPGYLPYEVKLEKTLNGNVVGNIYMGGVWIIVDVLTGAVFEQRVPAAARDLRARDLYGPPQAVNFNAPLYIVTHLQPDPAARKVGQMQRR